MKKWEFISSQTLFLWIIFLIHIEELVGHEGDDILSLQDIGPIVRHEGGAEAGAFDGSGHGGRGIALAAMVGSGDECIERVIEREDGVDGDGEGFIGIRAASQGSDAVDVVPCAALSGGAGIRLLDRGGEETDDACLLVLIREEDVLKLICLRQRQAIGETGNERGQSAGAVVGCRI